MYEHGSLDTAYETLHVSSFPQAEILECRDGTLDKQNNTVPLGGSHKATQFPISVNKVLQKKKKKKQKLEAS